MPAPDRSCLVYMQVDEAIGHSFVSFMSRMAADSPLATATMASRAADVWGWSSNAMFSIAPEKSRRVMPPAHTHHPPAPAPLAAWRGRRDRDGRRQRAPKRLACQMEYRYMCNTHHQALLKSCQVRSFRLIPHVLVFLVRAATGYDCTQQCRKSGRPQRRSFRFLL